ncbi:MAG TPA: hypothetical protein PLB01_00740 [Thermoanaerobaculia bacterium]|nr:hypothetical protein [Thermoanaerobaculia bacterium]
MESTRLERLRAAAEAFRRALLAVPGLDLPVTLRTFPVGACGDTCLLLGAYLHDLGLGPFAYVNGSRPVERAPGLLQSHAWLASTDGTVIDITAHQFSEFPEPVYVGAATAWHGTFDSAQQGTADFRNYDPRTVEALGRVYAAIRSRVGV